MNPFPNQYTTMPTVDPSSSVWDAHNASRSSTEADRQDQTPESHHLLGAPEQETAGMASSTDQERQDSQELTNNKGPSSAGVEPRSLQFWNELGQRVALACYDLTHPSYSRIENVTELPSLGHTEDDQHKPYQSQKPMTYSSEASEAIGKGFKAACVPVCNVAYCVTSRENRRAAWKQALPKSKELFLSDDSDCYVKGGGYACAYLVKSLALLTCPFIPGPDTCGFKPISSRSESIKLAEQTPCNASGSEEEVTAAEQGHGWD